MALDIITSVSGVFRRDYEVPSAELPSQSGGFLNPDASDALEQGEWLIPNSSGQYIRSTNHSAGTNINSDNGDAAQQLLAKCVFSVRGDYPSQALGKVTLIQSHGWEGSTDRYTGTPSIGDKLGLDVDSSGKVVLKSTTSVKDLVVAICTKAQSGGKIRFQAIQPYHLVTIN